MFRLNGEIAMTHSFYIQKVKFPFLILNSVSIPRVPKITTLSLMSEVPFNQRRFSLVAAETERLEQFGVELIPIHWEKVECTGLENHPCWRRWTHKVLFIGVRKAHCRA
jgi:hypothetical protein